MAYLYLTLLYTALVPFIIQIISIYSMRGSFYIIPIFVFVAMMLYGNVVIKADLPKKPNSMTGLYLPVVIPLLWYLICTGYGNAHGLSQDAEGLEQFSHGLVSLNLFGAWTFANIQAIIEAPPSDEWLYRNPHLDEWHYCTLFLNLFYYCILILGFAVGEQRASRKLGVVRQPFSKHKKQIAAVVLIAFSAYLTSEYVLYQDRMNIVSTKRPSYGFIYGGGYSSIDLQPYNVENEENILVKPEEPSTFIISDPEKMPIMDGAEAAYPVYSAFANACYEDIAAIQKKANERGSDTVMPIQFSNTIYAYEKLLTGEIDIFFGAKPSKAQIEMAEEAGVEMMLTPIGREAFVFFVNAENPVDNLSAEQLRDIYSGKTNNWREVGGKNQKILAFQRPENSGSQTMMEYFMGDTPLREPLETEYEASMRGVVRNVADYENRSSSLGYSFRYYTTIMMRDADSAEETAGIKILAVDGVYPDKETVRSGEYPYTTELYAITVASRADGKEPKETITPFLEWMVGPQGQKIVADTGYVALE